ncbi:MAG: metallophosphoesterase [Vicinamibacterales bacterium]
MMFQHKRTALLALWIFAVSACTGSVPRPVRQGPEVIVGDDRPPLALRPGSLKFAVIGDSGQWSRVQHDTAAQLAVQRAHFPFDLVLMLGDNNYGDGSPESYRVRFEEPYKALLDAGVTFFAARGNHDAGVQWKYPLFNMGGERYYTFQRKAGLLPPLAGDRVQFFALDSVNLDDDQLIWFDRQLSESKAEWKIVFFHHPIYSSGRYAVASAARRATLERVLIEHEVDVAFSGHEHVYERMTPQSGVMYFVVGASGAVRVGDLEPSSYQAAGYDRDLSFMLVEIAGNALYFRAVNRLGETVDRGKVVRTKASS